MYPSEQQPQMNTTKIDDIIIILENNPMVTEHCVGLSNILALLVG